MSNPQITYTQGAITVSGTVPKTVLGTIPTLKFLMRQWVMANMPQSAFGKMVEWISKDNSNGDHMIKAVKKLSEKIRKSVSSQALCACVHMNIGCALQKITKGAD